MKKYVYFIAPIVLLVVFFFGFYWNAHKGFEAKEQAAIKAARDAKQAKIEKEQQDRLKAVQIALEQQEKRRAEKKAREEKEALEKEEREKARQARDKAGRDADKLEQTVKRLQKEIEGEKKELAEVQAERKLTAEEHQFLKQYVAKAEQNQKSFTGILERIAAADKAYADALKAQEMAEKAAAAKKK